MILFIQDQQKQDEDEKKDGEDKENFATPCETPRRQKSSRKLEDRNTPVLSPSRSMDAGLNELHTPSKPAPVDWFATPSSRAPVTPKGAGSSKKVFGSLERGLDKMKNMLTPR